jgi:hypothetical protein
MNRPGTTLLFCAAILLTNFMALCGAAESKGGSAVAGDKLAAGVWGGQHLRMEVREGGVEFEFDCGGGQIEGPIALDGEGRFDVKGTFIAQHAGPVLRDEEANARPARYKGRVRGDTLTLTVTFEGSKEEEERNTYTLTRGSEGRLMKCR